MSVFSTEFCVSPEISETKFATLALGWLIGIEKSTVLDEANAKELDKDDAWIQASSGESLALKKVKTQSGFVIGLRHEMPDDIGRIWRTEGVLTNSGQNAYLQVKSQCVAISPEIPVETPKKPYFINTVLDEGWGGKDAELQVSSSPHALNGNDLDLAASIILGKSEMSLPIVYVSANSVGQPNVDVKMLAIALGGVAHVITEPSSDFSFQLSYLTDKENPYGGNIGVCVPGRGLIRNFFLGGSFPTPWKLEEAVKNFTISVASRQSVIGAWSWQDLQTEHSKKLRQQLRESQDDTWEEIALQQETLIADKDKLIKELEVDLLRKTNSELEQLDYGDSHLPSDLVRAMGKEMYLGEFSDRIRWLISSFRTTSQFKELDIRSTNVANQFLQHTHSSKRSVPLIRELKQAGKQGTKFGDHMAKLLKRLGYSISEDGKHMKASPPKDAIGGPTLTLPKTSSDNAHAGANNASTTINALGLKKL